MSRTKFVEKIKTHILCSINIFPENRAFYKIMWRKMIQPDRPQMQYNTAHSLFILSNLGYRQTHRINNTYFFLGNHGFTNAPQSYLFVCTVSVLFSHVILVLSYWTLGNMLV